MSIIVDWDDGAKTILRLDFTETWDATDYDRALAKTRDILGQSCNALDVMVVISNTRYADSPAIGVLTVIRSVLNLTIKRANAFVIVSDDLLLNSIVHLTETFYEYFGIKMAVVGSTDDAYSAIHLSRSN